MKRSRRLNTEARWRTYHESEMKNKKAFLKGLSENDGFSVLKELYDRLRYLGDKQESRIFDKDRLNTLARVHLIFGKVRR